MTRTSIFLAVGLALLSSFARASYTTYHEKDWESVRNEAIEHLSFRFECLTPDNFAHGSPVATVSLRNEHMTCERTFQVILSLGSCASVMRTVTIAPGGTASLSFPGCRTSERYSSSGSLLIIDQTLPASKPYNRHLPIGFSHVSDINVLIGGGLSGETFGNSLKAGTNTLSVTGHSGRRVSHSGRRDYDIDTLTLERPAVDWPTDYRVYTTFDAVVVTPQFRAAFPPEVLSALDDYQRLGGTVIDVSPDSLANPATALRIKRELAEAYTRLSHGRMVDEYSYSYRNDKNRTADLLRRIPLTVGSSLPIATLIGILAFFACVFVPTVVWICAENNRRLHLLFILPGVSLVLAVVVGFIALLTYGVTPTQRLQAVTLLDQSARRALTRGQFAVFSPRNVTDRIAFPSDAAIHYLNDSDTLSLVVTDALHPQGGWIKPLTATFFDYTRLARHAEKLEVKSVGPDTVTVDNLLGAKVTRGLLNFRGHTYTLGTIMPGEQVTLTGMPPPKPLATAEQAARYLLSEESGYGGDWKKIRGTETEKVLTENAYVVYLEGSPFFASPFGDMMTKGSAEAMVIGALAEEAK